MTPTDPTVQKSGFNRFFSSNKSSQKSGQASELQVPSIMEDEDHLSFRCCSAVAWDLRCAPYLSSNVESGIGLPSTALNALWKEFEGEEERRILARVPDSMDAEFEKQRFATEEFWKAQKRAADRQFGRVSELSSSPMSSDAESTSSNGSKQKRRPSPLNLNLQPDQTPQKPQLISPLRQHSPLDISLPIGVSAGAGGRSPQGEALPPLPTSATSATFDATPRATSTNRFTSENGNGKGISLHGRKRSQSVSRQASSSPAPSSSPSPSPSPSATTFADKDLGRGRLAGQTPRGSNLAPRSSSHLRTGSSANAKDYQADISSPTSSEQHSLPLQELRARRSLQNLSHERQRQSGSVRQKEDVPPVPVLPHSSRMEKDLSSSSNGGASVNRSSALSRPSISNLRRPSAPNLRSAAANLAREEVPMPLRPGMLLHAESYDQSSLSSRGPQSVEMGRAMTDDLRGAVVSPRGVFAPLHNVAMARNLTDQTGTRGKGRMDPPLFAPDRSSTRSSASSSSQRRHQTQHAHSSSTSSTSSSMRSRERMGMAPVEEGRTSSQSQYQNGEHQQKSPSFDSIQSGRSSIASLVSDGSSNLDSPTIDSPQTPLSALAKSPAEELHAMLQLGGDHRVAWDSSHTKKMEEHDVTLTSRSALQLDLYGPSGDESPNGQILQYLNNDPAANPSSDDRIYNRPLSPTVNFTPRAGRTSRKDNPDGSSSDRKTPVKQSQRASNNSNTLSSFQPLQQSPEEIQPTTQTTSSGFRSRTFSFGRSSKPRAATVSSGSNDQGKDRTSINSNSSSSKGSVALGLLLSQPQQDGNGRSRDSTSTISSSSSSNNSNHFNYSFETNPTEHSNPNSTQGHAHSSPIKKKTSFHNRRSNVKENNNSFQYEDQMNGSSGNTSPNVELSPTAFNLRNMMNRKQRKESFGSTQRTLTFTE